MLETVIGRCQNQYLEDYDYDIVEGIKYLPVLFCENSNTKKSLNIGQTYPPEKMYGLLWREFIVINVQNKKTGMIIQQQMIGALVHEIIHAAGHPAHPNGDGTKDGPEDSISNYLSQYRLDDVKIYPDDRALLEKAYFIV
jgi:hypothetical protein